MATAERNNYEKHKERQRLRMAATSVQGRDIAPLPAVVDKDRRAATVQDFRKFCESYFPQTFSLSWSEDHLKVIAKIERAVLEGGQFAMAMPRGSGKTSLCECACIWALLNGHREFVALIGADESHAVSMLDSIKSEFETNELLAGDYPEAIYPIQRLEGIAHRCNGQLYQGERTHIRWTAKETILPTIPGSKASGGVIKVGGITGRIRGMKTKRVDGTTIRPSLVILDDPQTDESARSDTQCAQRERILSGAILGLAGPGVKLSAVMPCTVICDDDLADRILDQDQHPEWNGERTKMLYSFPAEEKLWDQYAEVRAESLRLHGDQRDATAFYEKNREAMDLGCEVAWEARYNHDELSAIQHAMNLKLQDEAAFFSEYQNEPLTLSTDEIDLTPAEIMRKTAGHNRSECSDTAEWVTVMVDIQQDVLFWMAVAWEPNFTGSIIEYGAYPDQGLSYWALRDARRTLRKTYPDRGLEGAIYAGLERLTADVTNRKWVRDDGTELLTSRILIDANWASSTDAVYKFCKASVAPVIPCHGRYIGASSQPMSEYKRKRGDRRGLNWHVPSVSGKRAVRYVAFDANFWKSFVTARLATALGDPGCLTLFSDKPQTHRMLADHLTSEMRVRTEGRGRTVDEWKLKPAASDNHWFDCLVGCAVAASMLGASLEHEPTEPKRRPPPPDRQVRRVSYL